MRWTNSGWTKAHTAHPLTAFDRCEVILKFDLFVERRHFNMFHAFEYILIYIFINYTSFDFSLFNLPKLLFLQNVEQNLKAK